MRDRYFFSDVMVRGHYPSYAQNVTGLLKASNIEMQPEDEQILKEGKADYLGFSYYMSNTLDSSSHQSTEEVTDGIMKTR
ncbi:family 1 glycosylhydrolase [Vibrio chagasii]|nr:family 1 glycosylhydrolase [Vibrio chagasii]